ncbi:DUF6522 family protein [Paracoccus salsus]|uniref:DUF6522 family protein n=1 Tax=Paracoccus salsus TaxID=2911061 RepID=UPI001F1918F8|nr:DUF6522 family protein [Paracoccus salsus]MCF3973262.1 DUF6522 family protein [Paracoccus salsus]
MTQSGPAAPGQPRPPSKVVIENGAPVVDAAEIAALLGLDVAAFRKAVQSGEISTRLERGEDADAGKMRLTFLTPERRLRLTCDGEGNVLSISRAQRGGSTTDG